MRNPEWTSETAPRTGKRRGPNKWSFTYKDIAELCGSTVASVRTDVWRGALCPDELKSLSEYVVYKLEKKSRKERR